MLYGPFRVRALYFISGPKRKREPIRAAIWPSRKKMTTATEKQVRCLLVDHDPKTQFGALRVRFDDLRHDDERRLIRRRPC